MSSWHLSSVGSGRSGETEVRTGICRDLRIITREASKAGKRKGHKLHPGNTLTVHHSDLPHHDNSQGRWYSVHLTENKIEVTRVMFSEERSKVHTPFYKTLLHQYYTIAFEDPVRQAEGPWEPSRLFLFFGSLLCVTLLWSFWVKSSFKWGHYPLCRFIMKPGWESVYKVPGRGLPLGIHTINVGSTCTSLPFLSKSLSDAPSRKQLVPTVNIIVVKSWMTSHWNLEQDKDAHSRHFYSA